MTQNQPTSLLLNSSINISFINKKIIQFYKPPVIKVPPLMVTVTRENICNNANYQKDNWEIQGYQFTDDLRVIEMGVYHVVQKAGWLGSYAHILWDLNYFMLPFDRGPAMVKLGVMREIKGNVLKGEKTNNAQISECHFIVKITNSNT
jgi:Retroviral aspartyl protease